MAASPRLRAHHNVHEAASDPYFRPQRHLTRIVTALAPHATWQTRFVATPIAAFYEVQEGPYDPATAVEFVARAPAAGDAQARASLDWARTAAIGARYPSR